MDLNLFLNFISDSIKVINADIEKLYSNRHRNARRILDHLSSEVMMLDNFINHFSNSSQIKINDTSEQLKSMFAQQEQPATNSTRTFSLEELSKFNGKNGNPAYVAINGTVYDVTNNAAWAAATHFGLSAGNDLTNSFASCHVGADILKRLPVVGKLI